LSFNKDALLNIASEIGVVSKDGNPIPDTILDNMVSLEEQRKANFHVVCKDKSRNNAIPALDENSSSFVDGVAVSSSVVIEKVDMGGNLGTPPSDYNRTASLVDTKEGWAPTRVGRRKKIK
jgi:hypothetical protein